MHLLAQADPTNISGMAGDFAGKFGFPALLVMVLLYGIYKMQQRADTKQDKREESDAQREKERRDEREADRKAHVEALGAHTAALGNLGTLVSGIDRKLDTLTNAQQMELKLISKTGG